MTSDTINYKKLAASASVEFVKPGMIVGLGHGSTVQYALNAISAKLRSGELSNIIGIPCSLQTEAIAKELAIPLGSINDHPEIHVTIDGADEVDRDLNLIKGGGGALLREKIVAQASLREVIIVAY
jgi:ribose 5-phosphate isomerase A